MTSEAFFEFVANLFYPWLIKTQITLPVILFMNGHTSHLNLQTSQFCESHGIVLVAFYPNATHLLQLMDIAVFKILKEAWRKKFHEWRINTYEAPILKKKDFPKLLKKVVKETITQPILCNGFRKCGLYSWNPQAVQISNHQPEIELTKKAKNTKIYNLKQYFNC